MTRCECTGRGCPAHQETRVCFGASAEDEVEEYICDAEHGGLIYLCPPCQASALASGLYLREEAYEAHKKRERKFAQATAQVPAQAAPHTKGCKACGMRVHFRYSSTQCPNAPYLSHTCDCGAPSGELHKSGCKQRELWIAKYPPR